MVGGAIGRGFRSGDLGGGDTGRSRVSALRVGPNRGRRKITLYALMGVTQCGGSREKLPEDHGGHAKRAQHHLSSQGRLWRRLSF